MKKAQHVLEANIDELNTGMLNSWKVERVLQRCFDSERAIVAYC